MKNIKLVDKLNNFLPNFYSDCLSNDAFVNNLFDAYIEAANIITSYAKQTYYNTTLNTVEGNMILDTSVVTLRDALYDVAAVADKFQKAGLGNWYDESVSIEAKIQFLKSLGHYEELTGNRDFDKVNRKILTLDILKTFSDDTGIYSNLEDFVLQDSKLYVFNNLARHIYKPKPVLVKNVSTDVNKLESNWGSLLNFPKHESLTDKEYATLLQSIIKIKINGPSINYLREVITGLSSQNREAHVYDKYSKRTPYKYKAYYDQKIMGDFDFVVELSTQLLRDESYRTYLYSIVNALKPAYAYLQYYYYQVFEEAFGDVVDTCLIERESVHQETFNNAADSAAAQVDKTLNESKIIRDIEGIEFTSASMEKAVSEEVPLPATSSLSKFYIPFQEPRYGMDFTGSFLLNSDLINEGMLSNMSSSVSDSGSISVVDSSTGAILRVVTV